MSLVYLFRLFPTRSCLYFGYVDSLLLGLCYHHFFHWKHPSLLFILILSASAQQAAILACVPLDWTRHPSPVLYHVLYKLGDYLLWSSPACQDQGMDRPDSTPPAKSCNLNSRFVQLIVAEWNINDNMNKEVM